MKKQMPEKYRLRTGMVATSEVDGANGMFILPHFKITDYFIITMVSSGMGWEHVSVSLQSKLKAVERCPTWAEMCWVKDQYWNDDEVVIQYHPAKEDYVSQHPYCLHLWKPIGVELPRPNPLMVGLK